MKFCLVTKQRGEGCDYTIGCGYRWEFFEVGPSESAVDVAVARVREQGWRDTSENHVNQAFLVPADDLVDLAPFLDADVATERLTAAEMHREATEKEERAKLAALRAKYPDG